MRAFFFLLLLLLFGMFLLLLVFCGSQLLLQLLDNWRCIFQALFLLGFFQPFSSHLATSWCSCTFALYVFSASHFVFLKNRQKKTRSYVNGADPSLQNLLYSFFTCRISAHLEFSS